MIMSCVENLVFKFRKTLRFGFGFTIEKTQRPGRGTSNQLLQQLGQVFCGIFLPHFFQWQQFDLIWSEVLSVVLDSARLWLIFSCCFAAYLHLACCTTDPQVIIQDILLLTLSQHTAGARKSNHRAKVDPQVSGRSLLKYLI